MAKLLGSKLRSGACMAIVCASWALPAAGLAQSEGDVQTLSQAYTSGQIDASSFQSKMDAMLEAQPEPSKQLLLLVRLTRNLSRNLSAHRDLLAPYLDKALALPMEAPLQAQLLVYRANCYDIDPSFDSDRGVQTAALSLYLRNFDLIFTNQKEFQRQPLPGVDSYDIPGSKDSPRVVRARTEHEQQLAKRKDVEGQNQLVELRVIVEKRLTNLYKRLRPERTELERLLADHVPNQAAKQYLDSHLFN